MSSQQHPTNIPTANSSTSVPILINQYLASIGNDDEIARTYVNDIIHLLETKKLTLLQLIQNLGSSLTSDNDLIRAKSIQLLSETVGGTQLSRQDINVMIDFLLNKFNDKLSLLYSLQGINSLMSQKYYLSSNNEKILNKILNDYDTGKNLAKVRHEVFQILTKINDINELFIKTFLHIASGEKDPRNLLLSFKLNETINSTFKFDKENDTHTTFIQELFDVCFCYFPISFSPPSNDPYKITSEELKTKLRKVIASQSLFAYESFPNLIEKLASTNPMIRNDTLKTIVLCIEQYDSTAIEEHWLSLWNALKFEILHNDAAVFKPIDSIIPGDFDAIDDNDEEKVLFLTLIAFENIIKKLPVPNVMLDQAIEELNLKEKPKQAIIILATFASTSVENYNLVIDYVLNKVWGKYLNIETRNEEENEDKNEEIALNIQKQRELVDNFGFLLVSHPNQETQLQNYKDHLLIFFSQILTNSSNIEKTLRCKTIQQLINLIKIPNFLSKTNIELILDIFKNILFESTPGDIVIKEIINNLTPLMEDSKVSNLVIEFIINPILNTLNYDDLLQFKISLAVLSELCVNYQVLEVLSIRLFKFSISDEFLEVTLETFLKLFNKVEIINQFLTNSWTKNFIPKLLRLIEEREHNFVIIELFSNLLRQIVRFIDVTKHQSLLNEFHEKYKLYETEPTANIVIFTKILSAIDKSCKLNVDGDIISTIQSLDSISDQFLRIQYLQHMCLLINKFDNLYNLSLITEDLKAFEIYIWSLRALLSKLDKSGIKLLQDQLNLYKETKNPILIKSLPILFYELSIFQNPSLPKKLISKVNNLNVKLLYKQQIFEIILPYLLEDSDTEESILNYEILSQIISNISKNIIIPHLSEFLPFILKSFSINQTSIYRSSLKILEIIIIEDNSLILTNLKMIISNLILISTSNTNEEVKKLSLNDLLLIFQNFELEIVEKYKKSTLKDLESCLDDKKRSIRKLAIDLRQFIYELK
ncbi:uncharacterized protein KGF55_005314 [Candida pseudojiufengensis]|uniref:uncharacterized protein n=1 Tax=Candida pseudojiufengensis TaxID=497109 RepID=UPI00222502FF|nr:uncharacterized protein KGF55_005314 [Candida pseudojiufengensis]KAI5959486.1 hypothetical protein KGF55_005314 [Candida pseudojiufengensis]